MGGSSRLEADNGLESEAPCFSGRSNPPQDLLRQAKPIEVMLRVKGTTQILIFATACGDSG